MQRRYLQRRDFPNDTGRLIQINVAVLEMRFQVSSRPLCDRRGDTLVVHRMVVGVHRSAVRNNYAFFRLQNVRMQAEYVARGQGQAKNSNQCGAD